MSRPYLYFFNTNGAIITVINIAINKRGKIIRSYVLMSKKISTFACKFKTKH